MVLERLKTPYIYGSIQTQCSVGFADTQTEFWQGYLPEFSHPLPLERFSSLKANINKAREYTKRPAFVRGLCLALSINGYSLVILAFPTTVQASDYQGQPEKSLDNQGQPDFVNRTKLEYWKTWLSRKEWSKFFRTGALTPEFQYFLDVLKENAVPFMVGAGTGVILGAGVASIKSAFLNAVTLKELAFQNAKVERLNKSQREMAYINKSHRKSLAYNKQENNLCLDLLKNKHTKNQILTKSNKECLNSLVTLKKEVDWSSKTLVTLKKEADVSSNMFTQFGKTLKLAIEQSDLLDLSLLRKSKDLDICTSVLALEAKANQRGKIVLRLTNEVIIKDRHLDGMFSDLVYTTRKVQKLEKLILTLLAELKKTKKK